MPWNMFFDTEEAAISRYESEELIVAARIPAITKPAIMGGKKLVESLMKIFSESALVRNSFGKSFLPIIPMKTAIAREIITQTIAILLDAPNSLSLRIAIKRRSTWGIPK